MFQSSGSLGPISLSGACWFLFLLPNVCWNALARVLALLLFPHQEAPLQDRCAEIQSPVTWNRTRDHLITAQIYSQMLCQLSYDRIKNKSLCVHRSLRVFALSCL